MVSLQFKHFAKILLFAAAFSSSYHFVEFSIFTTAIL